MGHDSSFKRKGNSARILQGMGYRNVQAGDKISKYFLEATIGERGGGTVWKAHQVDCPARLVAVKILRYPNHVEQIRAEAQVAARLSHPNIVKTFEIALDADPPYFVMELVEGRNLRELVETEGILPPPYAIDIAAQVLDALHHAHENGLVHRNIKPENVLVDKKTVELADGRKALLYWVKLADLGLGRIADTAESRCFVSHGVEPFRGGARGEIYYMAPEQRNASVKVDRRADVYAVGVVLYEMLTGVLPLGVDLPSELNPVVSKELDQVAKRALSVDPDLRYANAAEMRDELARAKEAFLKGRKNPVQRKSSEPVPRPQATPRGPLATAWPLLQRLQALPAPQRFALLLASAAGVLLCGLFLFSTFHGPPPDRPLPPTTASIRLSTVPEGVEVHLDGSRVGVTPLKIEALTFERHEIRLKLRFHRDRALQLLPQDSGGRRAFRVRDAELDRELFTIDFSDSSSIDRVALDREHGSLGVETPGVEGVRVYLDDEFHGTAPVTLKRVPAGVYRLRLRKEGFRTLELPVTVLGDSRITLPILMTSAEAGTAPAAPPPAPGPAELCEVTILTEPDGARVFVDGEEQGGWTPTVLQLQPGLRRLRVEKEFFEPQQVDLSFSGPKGGQVGFRLVRLRSSVHVTSDPPGARVFLNDQLYGETPMRIDGIEAGSYSIRFEKEGHRPHVQEVEVRGTKGEVVHAVLAAAVPSAIRVRATVPGLVVYLGNVRMGRTGDGWLRFPAPPGRQTVVVGGVRFYVEVPEASEAMVQAAESDLGLVWVDGGSFRFGAKQAQGTVALKEKVVHAPGYWIDRYEVTNARYRVYLEYMAATGDHSMCHHGEPKDKDHGPRIQYWLDANFNNDDQPVVGVDYFDAWSYAAWAGKGLPTEVQWEKAARGSEGWEYPWGSEWKPKALNYGDFRAKRNPDDSDGHSFPAPVGSYVLGASPYGCYDMVGNVAEWCRDRFDATGELIVVRGGAWIHTDPEQFKVWRRDSARIHERGQSVGFRCVVEK